MQPCPGLREAVLRTLGATTGGLSGQRGKEAAGMSQTGGGHLGTPWRGQAGVGGEGACGRSWGV